MTVLAAVTGSGTRAELDLDLAAAELLARQRARLAERLDRLDPAGWTRRTRCPLWDVADVVIHLGDATRWALAALAGVDTGQARPGHGFDPATTPHEHVLAGRGQPPQELLARLREETATLVGLLQSHDGAAVPTVPWVAGLSYTPGLVCLHILWDSWLHELDLEPALSADGLPTPVPCPAELAATAAYGVFFTGTVAGLRLPPGEHLDLHVELDEIAYSLQTGPTVRLRSAEPGGPAPGARLLRGPAVPTIKALAGRGELTEVADGDSYALAVMSGLGARMRASAETAGN